MAAGPMRHRVQLQRVTLARDSVGEPIETWATYATVWASKLGGSGGERMVGQQVSGRAGVVLKIRYRNPLPTITERVVHNGSTYDINDVDDELDRHKTVVLSCTEVTG